MRRTQYIVLAALVVAVGFWVYLSPGRNNATEEPYQVGLVTWIGYAPAYLAKDLGYFEAEGINVEIRNMDQPGARESAFSAGSLDFFPNTPDAFVITTAVQPLPGRIIAAFDRSYGADGIIVKNDIRSALDLRGKKVGFEKGITSHYLLLWFLHQNGMSSSDIEQVSLSANDAGQSFLAGQLDAAATWEPWLSKARSTQGSYVLADSSSMNDRIVDVLMVSRRVLNDPEKARKFMRAWYRGLNYLQAHPDEADILLGRNWFQAKPEEVRDMRGTVRFMNEQESKKYVRERLPVVGDEISQLYLSEHLIDKPTPIRSLIDTNVLGK